MPTISTILIRNNETGEIRCSWEFKDQEWHELSAYVWEEGNYACDCNRSVFFARVKNPEDHGEADTCGDDKYSVRIISNNGAILYGDGDNWSSDLPTTKEAD